MVRSSIVSIALMATTAGAVVACGTQLSISPDSADASGEGGGEGGGDAATGDASVMLGDITFEPSTTVLDVTAGGKAVSFSLFLVRPAGPAEPVDITLQPGAAISVSPSPLPAFKGTSQTFDVSALAKALPMPSTLDIHINTSAGKTTISLQVIVSR